eukprot:9040941-Pyramimonas_sp.AAC.1
MPGGGGGGGGSGNGGGESSSCMKDDRLSKSVERRKSTTGACTHSRAQRQCAHSNNGAPAQANAAAGQPAAAPTGGHERDQGEEGQLKNRAG